MKGRISESDIDRVRAATDFVALASERLTLRRTGRRYQALCPFHDENTPSFSIEPESALYYCFGCGASGNVFHFVMGLDNLTFPEAVETLAGRAGLSVSYADETPADRQRREMRPRLAEALGVAVDFYAGCLFGPAGGQARDYLQGRGFGKESAEHFSLGWAPDQFDALVSHLKLKGFRQEEILAAGLGVETENGRCVDQLRARLVFPIFDPQGNPLAFAGRLLEGDGPKYKNSPETHLYKKSRTLYGLHWAKAEIVGLGRAVVVEGYTDVMGLHMAGATHAVAACGTALGEDHLRLLKRFTTNIVLAFDGDKAGSAATERVFDMAAELGLDVRVAELSEGQDPFDVARAGPAAVAAMLDDPVPLLEFKIERALAGIATDSAEGEIRAGEVAAAAIALHPDPDVRRNAASQVARKILRRDMPEDVVLARVEVHRRRARRSALSAPSAASPHDVGSREGGSDEQMSALALAGTGEGEDGKDAVGAESAAEEGGLVLRLSRVDEAALLSLVQCPTIVLDAAEDISEEWFSSVSARGVARRLLAVAHTAAELGRLGPGPIDVERCGFEDWPEALTLLRRLAVENAGEFSETVPWVSQGSARQRLKMTTEDFAADAAWSLYSAFLDRRILVCQRSLSEAESEGDVVTAQQLDVELLTLIQWRESLGER